MFKAIASAAAFAGVLLSATTALAQEQDFTVINRTGYVVVTMNVSPSDSTQWGPDILGSEVLADGESAEVSFDVAEDDCYWDIRVTYDDGDTGDWRQINLCETSTITLN